MDYQKTTMIPNTIFDNLLPSLSEKELKVLLIILRQTVGWVSKNGKRKSRDWISHRYFINTTGLSRKSITQAISLLIKKGFIRAETISHQTLESSNDRKGQMRIYYSCLLLGREDCTQPKVQLASSQGKILLTTKLTDTKLKPQTKVNSSYHKRLTDFQRYQQVLRERKGKGSL
jgi:hypothetical protein